MKQAMTILILVLVLASPALAAECRGSAYLSSVVAATLESDIPVYLSLDSRSPQEVRIGLPPPGETNGLGYTAAQARCEVGRFVLFSEAFLSGETDYPSLTAQGGLTQAWLGTRIRDTRVRVGRGNLPLGLLAETKNLPEVATISAPQSVYASAVESVAGIFVDHSFASGQIIAFYGDAQGTDDEDITLSDAMGAQGWLELGNFRLGAGVADWTIGPSEFHYQGTSLRNVMASFEWTSPRWELATELLRFDMDISPAPGLDGKLTFSNGYIRVGRILPRDLEIHLQVDRISYLQELPFVALSEQSPWTQASVSVKKVFIVGGARIIGKIEPQYRTADFVTSQAFGPGGIELGSETFESYGLAFGVSMSVSGKLFNRREEAAR